MSFCTQPAVADESRFAAELSAGSESLSSPLIRVSPNEGLLFVDGLTRLSGNYTRLAASAMHDWTLAGDGHLAVSGRIDWKRAPGAPDLDFGMVSTDLIWRQLVGSSTLGVGPTMQRMWVAGRRFRDVFGIQADWTRVDAGGHWMAVGELAGSRHGGDNSDFDSHLALLTAQRHIDLPGTPIDALDLEAGMVRERNARSFSDLSSRGVFARASADRNFAGITFSVGAMLQATNFDAAALDEVPARKDRYRAVELSAVREFDGGISLRLDLIAGRNSANSPLYESRHRQAAVTVSAQW